VWRTRARRPTVTAEPGLLALAPRSHAQRPSRRLRDSPAGCQEVRQIRRLAQARVAISNRPPAPATPTTGSPHRRRQAPANAAAAGKLLLALRSLAAPGPRVAAAAFRAHTLVRPGSLRADLERAHDRDYATEEHESRLGVRAIAAPVRGLDAEVVAALALSSAHATPTALVDHDEPVAGAAAELSARPRRDAA
jgi:DNA-binding IclR family transcriptional regulator